MTKLYEITQEYSDVLEAIAQALCVTIIVASFRKHYERQI